VEDCGIAIKLGLPLFSATVAVGLFVLGRKLGKKDTERALQRKDLEDACDDYAKLVEEQATILTHEALRATFRREAARCLGDEFAEQAEFALGSDSLRFTNALNMAMRDQSAGRPLRSGEDYLRAASEVARANFAELQEAFTLSHSDSSPPPRGSPTTQFGESFRRVSREEGEED